ncbi:MAG: HEAT repeat domain-containing protein [Planctomycetaceae bacterium]
MQPFIVCGLLTVLLVNPLLARPCAAAEPTQHDKLRAQLQSDDDSQRVAAAQAIAGLGTAAHPFLAELQFALRDKNPNVRWYAAEAIGQLPKRGLVAIPDLIKQLSDVEVTREAQEVWIASGRALSSIGSPAIPALIECLRDVESPRYYAAAATIATMTTDVSAAAPVLISQLSKTSGQSKWVSLMVLVKTGDAAKPAIPELIKATHDMDFHIQTAACDVLGALGASARPAVPRLVQLLSHRITSVRGHAAYGLGEIGPVPDQDVVGHLLLGASDKHDFVREKALQALARIGKQAVSTLPTLQKHLRNVEYANRVHAAYAVWRISGHNQEPLQILLQLASERDSDLEAIMMIGRLGPAAGAAVPTMIEYLGSDDPDIRLESAQTLGQIGAAAQPALTELNRLSTKDADSEVREQAAAAVKSINNPTPKDSAKPDGPR